MKRFNRFHLLFAMLATSLLCTHSHAEEEPNREPQIVKKITDVKIAEQELNPPTLVVTAFGEVASSGFKAAMSRVVYVTPPADGIQDYFMYATPPTGIVTPALATVSAQDKWPNYGEEAPWLKGVRIHGVDDGVMVRMRTDKK